LNFEVVYFVTTPDYTLYMDVQEAINLDLFRRFEEEGIEFAYPTQTLFVQRDAS
jgi:small-conductance mechanosensitive channel